MKKSIVIVLAVAAMLGLLAGCQQKAKTVEGTVIDATMNTITVVTPASDTVCVSTAESDTTLVPSVFVGDVVKIDYKVAKGDNGDVFNATALTITTPSNVRLIAGTWEKVADTDTTGFVLSADSSAKSINLGTLDLKNWSLNGQELTLSGENTPAAAAPAKGKKAAVAAAPETFTEVYEIAKLDQDSLVLNNKDTQAVVYALARVK